MLMVAKNRIYELLNQKKFKNIKTPNTKKRLLILLN